MSDYRSRLAHHLDETERAELATLRAFRAQYADDAAAVKGGRERLEHAEREVERLREDRKELRRRWQKQKRRGERAEAAVAAGLALHVKQRRYQHPDADMSFDTPEDAAEWDNSDVADITHFDICAECGRIETAEDQHDPGYVPGFLNAMWPCPTRRVLDGNHEETT